MEDFESLKNKLLNKDGSVKFCFGRNQLKYIQKYLTEQEINLLNTLPGESLSAKIYSLKHNIFVEPTCVCGKKLKFLSMGQGFQKYCSNTCTLKNRGVSEDTKMKRMKTNIERFGSPCAMNSSRIKERASQKRKDTNLKKYGVEYSISSDEVKSTIMKSIVEKYGSYEKYNEARSATIKERYSTGIPQQKCKETNLAVYGVDNINKLDVYKKNLVKTAKISKSTYFYRNIKFDSKWELAFYIYNKDLGLNIKRNFKPIKYKKSDGKEHNFYPDFILNGKLIEVKGDQFLKEPYYSLYWKDKEAVCISNNIKILYSNDISPMLKYIYSKYGKNYLKQFKADSKSSIKRKVVKIKRGDDIYQYRNSNIKFQYNCEKCNKVVYTSYVVVDHFKDFLCKFCRKELHKST